MKALAGNPAGVFFYLLFNCTPSGVFHPAKNLMQPTLRKTLKQTFCRPDRAEAVCVMPSREQVLSGNLRKTLKQTAGLRFDRPAAVLFIQQ